jgi:hypothetical protein
MTYKFYFKDGPSFDFKVDKFRMDGNVMVCEYLGRTVLIVNPAELVFCQAV